MHVYHRDINAARRTSLSVIASLVAPGAKVLDLGMGSGALGQHLGRSQPVVIDGITHNPHEAQLARAHYRRALVVDLETCALPALLAGETYDYIVCADVFEHLREPEKLLAQLPGLLAPGGRLLSSVPNASYCGLVAELLDGEFRYREEGLLDHTHLRFFTHRSLLDWYQRHHWQVLATEPIELPLADSEFQPCIDALPPSVARYLLSRPEAFVYQFVMQAVPAGTGAPPAAAPGRAPRPQAADFVLALYGAGPEGFSEQRKWTRPGVIGQSPQRIVFDLPAGGAPLTGLRLDPADRPGLLHLFGIHVTLTDGTTPWHWPDDSHPAGQALRQWPAHQIIAADLWPTPSGALLLSYGDDPQLHLPIAPDALRQLGQQGGHVEVSLGWPMSGDYAPLARQIAVIEQTLTQERDRLLSQNHDLTEHAARSENNARRLEQTNSELNTALARLRGEFVHTQQRALTLEGEYTALQQHLAWIKQSTVFRVTRPLVKLKMQFDRLLRPAAAPIPPAWLAAPAPRLPAPGTPVDVIVPVYRGLDDTRRCLQAVIRHPCRTPMRLIVIDDCGPEPELTAWLAEFVRQHPQTVLLRNEINLGFVATVNRGMAQSDTRDVVLLNSDAEVSGDWLDRLQAAAYAQERIATVTPFSNNATICSYPRFCEANPIPAGQTLASLDRLCATLLPGRAVEVPTAHGFCMYIRRAALQETGLFDVETFGKGYGEENDFSMRAHRKGWKHLHALDVFVRHAGGTSFGAAKSELELRAIETLRHLHPDYEPAVQRFIQADPTRPARLVLDLGRIMCSGQRVVLNVTHNRDGGTLRHQHELAALFAGQAVFLTLLPIEGGAALRLTGAHEGLNLSFRLPAQLALLLDVLHRLGVGHIHYHHLLGHADVVSTLAVRLGVRHDFTAHDFFSYCPQISLTDHTGAYCGEHGPQQCRQCLARTPAPGGLDIEHWRARHRPMLDHARHVLCPSPDTARRLRRQAPGTPIVVVPHPDLDCARLLAPAPALLAPTAPLKVVVLGALSQIKGADLLEATARLAAKNNAPVEFHLIGHGYRHLATQPKTRLTVHGAYAEADLPALLRWLQPDLAWFPAQWPETYSYTLSACLQAGLPVLAPRLGAFADRLAGRPWSWLADAPLTPQRWLTLLEQLRQDHFLTGRAPDTTEQAPPQPAWHYLADYLKDLPPRTVAPHQDVLALAQICLPLAGQPKQQPRRLLHLLAALRATPGLAWLTRNIPAHTQRRVKDWLSH